MGHPASLQARLLIALAALALGVGALMGALASHQARHELDELLDAHLAQAAALLVVQHNSLPHDDDRVLDAPSLHRYAPRAAFQVFHEGALVLRSAQAPVEPLVSGMSTGFHTVTHEHTSWRVFVTRGGQDDVTVMVGERSAARREILHAVLTPLAGVGAAALLLMLLLSAGVLHWGLAPLRALRSQLQQRRPEQLSPLELPRAPAELAPVLAALNALFARIEMLLLGERRLTADAAHELRTPIAAIRAQAQVARGASDSAERDHALAATLAGCDRAARLIDQLLMMARLEAAATPPRSPLALHELARQALADAAESPLNRGHVLALEAAGPVPAEGDPLLTQVLLRNLLDNALRYSPPGSPVTLTVEAGAAGDWQLRVEDGGRGLDEAGLARLGQRFQRGAVGDATGSGLGWSIVKRIAALQGWSVRAGHSSSLSGLSVRLTPEKPAG
ncbi:MAG: two-component sensor histidine kinase [Roseateles depolymerans]|uniref:histidine kinase n=1 Tax=Roseateles depolymerans TaxID=76731 RepID=A0A2W5FQI7_9BURK|nr:MAG: two-component sensor histidine kinase [Roseateles depolymerans]